MSSGSGDSNAIALPSTGCRNASRRACRNSRFTPCRASARLSSKSPYLSSPSTGWPGVREVHADLVGAAGHEAQLEQADDLAVLQ